MASKRAKTNIMKFHSEEWKDNKMKAENIKGKCSSHAIITFGFRNQLSQIIRFCIFI